MGKDTDTVGIPLQQLSYDGQATASSNTSGINVGSKERPIDLTTDVPSRKTASKRRMPDEFASRTAPRPSKRREACSTGGAKKCKENKERRLYPWRDVAPAAYYTIRVRALTQRMFVLDRQRDETHRDHPVETVTMAGTTGNVYTVRVDKVPSCDCPHAIQGNQCKHILYVLSRVLRVRGQLEYQLAFVSAELRHIFRHAPPLPSQQANDSTKDGNRKPLEGECPICCDDLDSGEAEEQIVYCKASCGNNIHKQCLDRWAETRQNERVTCPFCRAPWVGESGEITALAAHGYVNEDGYFNIAAELGISEERNYSTYRRRRAGGLRWDDDYF